jgi:hypothetical protein
MNTVGGEVAYCIEPKSGKYVYVHFIMVYSYILFIKVQLALN